METAIKKAIEGGYPKHKVPENIMREYVFSAELVLDPLFWQALGKAEGWSKRSIGISYEGYEIDVEGNTDGNIDDKISVDVWQMHWHRFIDHLAEGKDIESFFTSLILSK